MLVLVGLFLIYPTVNAAQDVTIQPTYKTGPFAGQTPSGGLEPNSEINLNIVFTGDTNACSGSLGYQLFRTLAHAKGGNLNDVEYLANDSGGSATFSYEFNSGPSGQRNVYWAIFYCWSSPVPGVALGTARLWQSYKFDQTTVGAPCSFLAPAWGQTDGKVGSTVPLSVKGTTAGCKGVSFSFEIWRGGKDLGNRLETTVASSFPASGNLPLTATANWKIASNQKYAFKIRLAEGGCARTTGDVCLWSGDLSSSGGGGDTADGSSTAGGEKECKGGLVPCGRLCNDPTTPEDETRPCTTCDIFALASRVVNFVLFTLVPAIAVLSYLIAGFMILLGGARPGLIAKGRSWFWDTTIGLVIIFGSWMITNTVLKSLVGDSDISNNWHKIECTGIVQGPPVVGEEKYTCNDNDQCVADPNGEYNTSDCDNECAPSSEKLYTCSEDQCIENPDGEYTTSNCDNKCTIMGNVPVIITTSLPDGAVNQNYSQTLQATGGKSPYSWTKAAGNLPPGLNLATSGTITGTPATAGTYTFTVKVEDSTTPTKQSATKEVSIKVVIASAAVTISNVAASNITPTSATITWTTDKPSTSQVEYGTTSSFGSSTTLDNTQKASHSVNLTGLTANTTYYYRAKSSVTGFTAILSTNTFKTLAASGVQCPFSGVDLCQPGSTTCPSNACNQYSAAISQAATKISISGVNSLSIIKSIMFNESTCNVSAVNQSSCGLMQLNPATANMFRFKCGAKVLSESITCSWLTNPSNAAASICIGAQFIQAVASGTCGSQVRNIAAGYNGGVTACQDSVSCSGDKSCDGGTVRKWECLYDDSKHTKCNTGYNETRTYAPRVLACYNKQ